MVPEVVRRSTEDDRGRRVQYIEPDQIRPVRKAGVGVSRVICVAGHEAWLLTLHRRWSAR